MYRENLDINKENKDIRKAIRDAGLRNYQVAHELGIKSDATFTKWLRYELPDEKKNLIYKAIEIARGKYLI